MKAATWELGREPMWRGVSRREGTSGIPSRHSQPGWGELAQGRMSCEQGENEMGSGTGRGRARREEAWHDRSKQPNFWKWVRHLGNQGLCPLMFTACSNRGYWQKSSAGYVLSQVITHLGLPAADLMNSCLLIMPPFNFQEFQLRQMIRSAWLCLGAMTCCVALSKSFNFCDALSRLTFLRIILYLNP